MGFPSSSLQVAGISWKGACALSWQPDFAAATQGTPLEELALEASRACVCESHRTETEIESS